MNLSQTTDERQQQFMAILTESEAAVWCIAQWLTHRGHDILIPRFLLNPDVRRWREYADDGDLFIVRSDDTRTRIEVRHISEKYPFTCRDDWPHGEKFLIERVPRYDRKKPSPEIMFFVNHPMTHTAVVMPNSSFEGWYVEERAPAYNRPEEGSADYYLCPMGHVKFMEIGP